MTKQLSTIFILFAITIAACKKDVVNNNNQTYKLKSYTYTDMVTLKTTTYKFIYNGSNNIDSLLRTVHYPSSNTTNETIFLFTYENNIITFSATQSNHSSQVERNGNCITKYSEFENGNLTGYVEYICTPPYNITESFSYTANGEPLNEYYKYISSLDTFYVNRYSTENDQLNNTHKYVVSSVKNPYPEVFQLLTDGHIKPFFAETELIYIPSFGTGGNEPTTTHFELIGSADYTNYYNNSNYPSEIYYSVNPPDFFSDYKYEFEYY